MAKIALLLVALALPARALVVSSAISLKPVLDELAAGDESLTLNYGSSGALLRQIENGAPADVFLSAARAQVDELAAKGLAASPPRVIATNKLVVVIPAGAKKAPLATLLGSVTRFALGEPRSVPAGTYAKEALTSLTLWEAAEKKAVFGGSVRQVLAFVESASAQAGVVYETDTRDTRKVEIAERLDGKLHSPIEYVGVVVATSKDAAAAKKFLDVLASETGRRILERHGFGLAAR